MTSDLEPFIRDAVTGFRCISRVDPSKAEDHLDAPIWTTRRITAAPPRIDDAAYELLCGQLTYERFDATASITMLSRTPRIVHERVDLSYPNRDSLMIHILRPVAAPQPLQSVVLIPGTFEFAVRKPTDVSANESLIELVIDSGRALVWPVLFGSNERFAGVRSTLTPGEHALFFRDAQYEWRKDLGRTLDYLESRADFDAGKVAYLGISYGTNHPLPAVSQETRFKALIFVGGGLLNLERPPIATMSNFLPHIKLPAVMINGRYDYVFPYVESQLAMFHLLGTPVGHKTHIALECGHGLVGENAITAYREAMQWLDGVLGEVC